MCVNDALFYQILLYVFFQILGKGSFGLVIRGRWRGIDVAIKIFQTEQDHSAFFNELRQSSRVEHENIIKLYGASTQPPFIFLVMEYAENNSLYKLLHKTKPQLPYNSGHAISWAIQCARGVAYLHNMQPKPLIHRYVKVRKYVQSVKNETVLIGEKSKIHQTIFKNFSLKEASLNHFCMIVSISP